METLNKRTSLNLMIRWSCALILIIFLLLILGALDISYAATEETQIELLKKLKLFEIDSISDVGTDFLRRIGYSIIRFFGSMVDGLYNSLATIYNLLSFSSSEQLTSLVERYSVLYKTIFTVSLVFLGIYLMHTKNHNQLNTINCIIIIIFVITAMPLFTQKMTALTVKSTQYAQEQWTKTAEKANIESIASTVLTSNIVDLKKVDNNIKGNSINGLKKNKSFNYLKPGNDDWKLLDINAVMDPDDNLKSDVWESKLVMQESGDFEIKNMQGILTWDTYYYRYQIKWFNCIAELMAAVVVLFFVCLKCGKLVIDIAMNMVYTPFVALTDLVTGQRIKECIKNLFVLFATIFLCVALVGVYFAGFSFINEEVTGAVPTLVMHIALAWAVLDGPNVLERITGVDVGSKGVWQKLMGARAAVGLAGGAVKAGAKTVKTAGKVGNTAGNILIGKERMNKATEKVADTVKGEVKKATDGKGLLGFGNNAAKGIEDKMTPKDSVKGVEHTARNADSDFGKILGGKEDKLHNTHKVNGNESRSIHRPAIARPDRREDNLKSGMRKPTGAANFQDKLEPAKSVRERSVNTKPAGVGSRPEIKNTRANRK